MKNQKTDSGTDSGKKWTDEELAMLLLQMEAIDKIHEADNRKLLWLAKNLSAWEVGIFSLEGDILNEIENRLYPEYDGENVTFEKWGWKTPQGEIRYLAERK